MSYVIGIDFGTLSGRALVVRVEDGAERAVAEHVYPHGVIDESLGGVRLPPDWALQDPDDWIDVLRTAVPEAVRRAGVEPREIVGLATDTTACTVLPCRRDGTPLCREPALRARPHAWPKLWRHHAAQPHADRANALAEARGEPWLARYGGRLSSEWEIAKALQVLEEDAAVWAATEQWVEFADWIVWQLCGTYLRNRCTAGYKGAYQDGGYPSADYFGALNPAFADYPATRLDAPLADQGTVAGRLTDEAAAWTGLPAGIPVAVGNVDAHVTVPAARAIEPGTVVAVMGTSTCHVLNGTSVQNVPGMCGVVDGGISAGAWGYEAGQSGVGDIFAWWAQRFGAGSHDVLTAAAAEQAPGAHGLVALDWMSGNRSVLVDHELSGVIAGLTLETRPADVYRALLEATAFGTRRILDAFTGSDVPVHDFVAAGGLIKNEFLMQLYADVLGRPVSVIGTEQGPALGAAIHAAVAAGAYPDVAEAADVMGGRGERRYEPDVAAQRVYDELYDTYLRMHDWFGWQTEDLHALRRLRNRARSAP